MKFLLIHVIICICKNDIYKGFNLKFLSVKNYIYFSLRFFLSNGSRSRFFGSLVKPKTTTNTTCRPVLCKIFCSEGYVIDQNGCPVCSCATRSTILMCPRTVCLLPCTEISIPDKCPRCDCTQASNLWPS